MPTPAEQETASSTRIAVQPQHVRVAIVGAGFSGLGLAIRLKQQGMHDFVVLERAGRRSGLASPGSIAGGPAALIARTTT